MASIQWNWLKAIAEKFTPVTFTQTDSTKTATVAAPTGVAPTIGEALTGVDTGTDMTAAQAGGLVADIASLETQVNALIVDVRGNKSNVNELVDLLQDMLVAK